MYHFNREYQKNLLKLLEHLLNVKDKLGTELLAAGTRSRVLINSENRNFGKRGV